MLCPSCATDNRPGATRCRRCGSGITRSCPGCGGPIARTEPLCSNCRTQPVPADADGNPLEADNADDGIPIEEIDELLTDSLPPEAPGFIGRTQLLGELTSRIESAHTSRRLVLQTITGEAGVGKTRLAAELCRICEADHPLRVLWGTADESSPYAAFLRLLRQRFSIADEDPADKARQRINDEVRQLLSGSRQRELVELLLQFLGYPPDDLVLGEELDPRAENTVQLEARTFLAIRRILAADAQRAPLLLILDDMERAAPETVNLVMYLAAGLDACAVAIVVLGRPVIYTTHPALGGVGDVAVERAALMPLEPAEASAFLKDRLGLGTLDDRLAAWAAHELGGVPRALVELARFLEETGAVIPGTPARLDADILAGVQMPDSLDQILAARLELLEPSERDLLEKAAAVGEVFWLDALVALVRSTALEVETPNGPSLAEITLAGDRPRPAIEHSLGNLQRRGFVVELPTSTIPGERELRFTYPPWWEVVSQRLSHDHKKRYHRLVAEWLELRPEGRREEAQEEIGRHLEQAGWGDEAALRYRRAGDAARARYFNEKAIRLYESAIACTSPGNVSRRILLWHDLGSVYELRGNVEAALGAFEHMLRLSWVIVSRTKAAVALNKLGRIYRQKGELDLALEYLDKGLALFRQASDHRGIAASLDDLGQTMWLLGRYDEALDRSAAGLESRRKLGDKRSIASSLLSIGNIERHRGLFLPAEACFREALELRQQLRDRHGIAQCQNALGVLALQRGDLHVAKANWEAALDAAVDLGAAQLEALVLIHLGEAARAQGHHEEARVRFEEAITRATEIGERRLLSDAERQLGLVSLHFGDSVGAKQRCGNALRLAESAGIQVLIGRALIALGEVDAVTLFDDTMGSTDGAPEHYRRGVEIFRHIRNDAELAWALERYGRFCVERGDVEAGRGLLSESAQLFTRLGLPQGKSVYRVLEDL